MRSGVVEAGVFGKQAAVMEMEGGCRGGPRTGEPFTAERVAVLHEGRDAAEGELQERHVKAQGSQIDGI